jgi:16S rRNA (adenine1518-N6/adenine1519-N6)-dimethyltransferase
VAVELDEELLPALREYLSGFGNVRVVQGDILKLSAGRLVPPDCKYKVVANLPYYITSAVIRHFLEDPHPPESMVLTVQWEVAGRMSASPPKMSLLAVSVQVYGEVDVLFRVPAGAFYPPPKVDSGVVRIRKRSVPLVPPDERKRFFRVVKAGFSQRRKQLHNALSAGLGLPSPEVKRAMLRAGIQPHRRAETLSVEEWLRLSREFGANPGNSAGSQDSPTTLPTPIGPDG